MVVGHTCGQPLYNWIYSFHMPLFFIVSGLFFSPNKYTPVIFLKRRFKQLVVPLLIFTTFVICIYSVFIPERNVLSNLELGVLPGALWFLYVMFLLQTLYFFLVSLVKSNKFLLLIVVFISMFIGTSIRINSANILYIGTIFSSLPFYALAHLLSAEIRKLNQQQIGTLKLSIYGFICLLFPLIVVLYTGKSISLWDNVIPSPIILYYITACIGSIGIIFLSKAIINKRKYAIVLTFLGKNTLPIVALNQLIIDLSVKYLNCPSHVCFKVMQQLFVWSLCLLTIKFCNRYFRIAIGK